MGHNHHHGTEDKKGLIISIILNSIIVIGEFIGGILSGSLSLLSDAVHNLSDVISLVFSYFGEILSKKKGNNKYTFDYKRAEIIIAFLNSITLILIGFYIIYEAIFRFLYVQIQVNSFIMFVVGFIGLVGNLVSILFLYKEKDDNLNKKSAYLHLFYDAISSVLVVLGGIIIFYTKIYSIDLIASIVISFFVIRSGFDVFKQSLHILMQGVPDGIDLEKILYEIKSISGVESLHYLRVWSIDSNEIFLSAHIVVDKEIDNENLLRDINKFLHDNYHIHNTSLQIVKNNCC